MECFEVVLFRTRILVKMHVPREGELFFKSVLGTAIARDYYQAYIVA